MKQCFLLACAILGFVRISATAAEPLDMWHQRSSPVTTDLRAVAFGGGKFVAVSEKEGHVLTSVDGTSWLLGSIGKTNIDLEGVSFCNNQFIAVGGKGSIFTSPDGLGWTPRDSGTSSYLHDVHHANGQYVVVGENGRILTSPDTINWTPHNTASTNYWKDVTFINGQYVAVGYYYPGGSRARVATSPDAVTWTFRAIGSSGSAEAIAFANGTFVVCADSGYLHTSPDAVTWGVPQQPNTSWLKDIIHTHGTFVTVGWNGTIQTSPDGSAWKIRTTPVLNHLIGVASGNNTIVAVGYGGTILQSDPLAAGATPITLTDSARPAGQFQFRFAGEVGQSYQVQVSSNLIHWTFLQTVACTNVSMSVTDAASSSSERYYRVFRP